MSRKQYPDGSWTVRVPGRRPNPNPTELDKLAGDGRYGFQTRPQSEGVVRVESTADGQALLRSARKSVCHPRKTPRRLVSKRDLVEAKLDRPLAWASPRAVRRMEKKLRRKAARAAR